MKDQLLTLTEDLPGETTDEDATGLSMPEYSVVPSPDVLELESTAYERKRNEVLETAAEYETVQITHTDADGYGAAVMVRAALGDHGVITTEYDSPVSLAEILELLASDPPERVIISDFALDGDAVDPVHEALTKFPLNTTLEWYDHHEWTGNARDAVTDADVELIIEDDECATTILHGLLPDNFSPALDELADVTRDLDLWIKDDSRSDQLATYAAAVSADEYIDKCVKHGIRVLKEEEDLIQKRQTREQRLLDLALSRARILFDEPGTLRVIATYGKGNSSEIGNALVEQTPRRFIPDEDTPLMAVVMKPHGGAGLYAHSDETGFTACHRVARKLDGGGHTTAAGGHFGFDTFDGYLDYWRSRGESVEHKIVDAVTDVLDNLEDIEEASEELKNES